MSQRHPRAQLAAITAGLATAALLAGPAATWALDVTGVTGSAGSATTQVTGAVQGAVDTTQQTVATTVTNVESTAPTTVQTTTQAAQPVVNQVHASAPATPAAPSAPAPKPASRPSAATRTVARNPVGVVHTVRTAVDTSSARSLRQSVAAPARTPSRRSLSVSAEHHSSPASAPTSTAASPGVPQCDSASLVQILSPLLAVAPPVGALLTAACDTGNSLLGLPPTGTGREAVLPLAGPAGAIAALAARVVRANARGASLFGQRRGTGRYPLRPSEGGGDPLAGAASHTGLATTVGTAVAAGGSFASAGSAIAGRHGTSADPSPATRAGDSHTGLFGTSITGTEVVFAILVLDWAILVALVMWRVARRRPVLRYAIAWRARRAQPGSLSASV